MTKKDYIKKMKNRAEGIDPDFITKKEIACMLGIKKLDHVTRYVEGLKRLNNKYYMIDEVADRMMQMTR